MCKLAKYVRNCVVFWKNLHSWQKFYTTAGRDGRDKFQVWVHTFFQTIRPADCVLFTCIDRNQPSLKSVECAYCTDLQLEDNNNLKTMSMFCYRWLCTTNQVSFNTSSKKCEAWKLKIEFASGFLMTAATYWQSALGVCGSIHSTTTSGMRSPGCPSFPHCN